MHMEFCAICALTFTAFYFDLWEVITQLFICKPYPTLWLHWWISEKLVKQGRIFQSKGLYCPDGGNIWWGCLTYGLMKNKKIVPMLSRKLCPSEGGSFFLPGSWLGPIALPLCSFSRENNSHRDVQIPILRRCHITGQRGIKIAGIILVAAYQIWDRRLSWLTWVSSM